MFFKRDKETRPRGWAFLPYEPVPTDFLRNFIS